MDQQLKQIDSFLRQKQCLFNFDILDYPTLYQQQLITSYLHLTKIMSKQHNQIIRQLHSSNDQTLQTIAQGFIYSSLIDLSLLKHYSQYIIILRIEIWALISRNLQILLHQCLDVIKVGYLGNLAEICRLLVGYGGVDGELVRGLVKIMEQYEREQARTVAVGKLLGVFEDMVQSPQNLSNQQIGSVLYSSLFLKCLRLVSIPSYNKPASTILTTLLQNQPKSLQFLYDKIIAIQSQPSYRKNPLLEQIHTKLLSHKHSHIEQYMAREMIYGCLLPKSIQSLLQYLLVVENMESSNIRLQLNWLAREWNHVQMQFFGLLVDIAVWVSLSFDNINRRVYILDWALRKAYYSHGQSFKLMEKFIFERWFRDGPEDFAITSIVLLKHMIYTDHKIGNELFTYLLKNSENQNQGRIRRMFKFGHQKGYLKFQEINLCDMINVGVKQSLRNLMGGYSTSIQPPQSPISLPSPQQNNPQINYDSPTIITIPTKITQQTYILNIQEQYTIKMGTQLNNLLDDPSIENFKRFLSRVCQVGVCSRKEEDYEELTLICEETAKVIYVMFNCQFEDYQVVPKKEESAVYQLLNYLMMEWHRVTHKLQVHKQIIKTIIRCFPTTEPAIWRYFFTYFEYGGKNNRSIKNWLISSQQSMKVTQILQKFMGRLNENIKKNMNAYGLKPI